MALALYSTRNCLELLSKGFIRLHNIFIFRSLFLHILFLL